MTAITPTQNELEHPTMTRVALPADYPWLARTSGREHQRKASAWRRGHGADGRKHSACAFEMGLGTGKTLTAIEEFLKLLKVQPGAKCLVLAPNAVLRTVWEEQVREHGGKQLRVAVLDGPMAKRRARLQHERNDYDVWIHNHESLAEMGDALGEKGWGEWDLVILDEHSKFRNHQAARCKWLLGRGRFLRKGCKARTKIALSGTPVIKKATDVFVTYKWLGGVTETLTAFRQQHCIMGGYMGYDEVAIKPNSGLAELLNQHRFVVPKEAVLNLPRAFHTRLVDLTPVQKAAYKRVRDELRTQVFEGKSTTDGTEGAAGGEALIFSHLTLLLRLEEVVAGYENTGEAYQWWDDNAKATYLFDELLPEVAPDGEKVILWCWFRAEIRELERMARARGLRPVTFFGEVSATDRVTNVNAFRHGDANLFIGQEAAAGLGLNLPEAQTMIYYSRSFDTEAYMQSLDRNYRLTSRGALNVITLEARDTIDQHITRVLRQDVTQAATISSLDVKGILGI